VALVSPVNKVVVLAKEGSSFQITRSKACVFLAKLQSSRGIIAKECKGAGGPRRSHDMLNPSCFYSRCGLGQDFFPKLRQMLDRGSSRMPATFYVIVQILSESSSENEPSVHPCIVARGPRLVARD
jgi:hypothetical protein